MDTAEAAPPPPLTLVVGGVYRAKRPRRVARFLQPDLYNDRQILWISPNGERIQYDSPTIRFGRHYPTCHREQFLQWAGSDMTSTYKEWGLQWAEWPRRPEPNHRGLA